MAILLHSREGVIQKDALAMFAYGIGVLLMIKQLKAAYPDITHPWYAENAGSLGTYNNIELYFNFIKESSPGCGYYPKHSKIYLIVHPDNPKTVWLVSHVYSFHWRVLCLCFYHG